MIGRGLIGRVRNREPWQRVHPLIPARDERDNAMEALSGSNHGGRDGACLAPRNFSSVWQS